jgi:hypothetical protein
MRMHSVTSTIENGFVHLPDKASWLGEYLHELASFPLAGVAVAARGCLFVSDSRPAQPRFSFQYFVVVAFVLCVTINSASRA